MILKSLQHQGYLEAGVIWSRQGSSTFPGTQMPGPLNVGSVRVFMKQFWPDLLPRGQEDTSISKVFESNIVGALDPSCRNEI